MSSVRINGNSNDDNHLKYKNVYRIPDLILKKRDGRELTEDEINYFVKAVVGGDENNNASIQPSQIGAMLMAIYYNGMNFDESFHLTRAMMNSGERLTFPKWRNCLVDKHSTGGVGDKISLPLAPALVACGLKVPMISGRGLGFTGGTLDKLESIPGYRVSCSKEEITKYIDEVGCCIVGQTRELNPADAILYATRDITSTVDCIPLIAGSIVSKKAIEDLDALVLDLKIGKAAFLKTLEKAEKLGDYMINISRMLGLKAAVFITNHDNPLGRAIGNQIEIEETIECLHGRISSDLAELTSKFGGYLLYRTGNAVDIDDGARKIMEKLSNGEALKAFKSMIIAQGVNKDLATELCDKRNYKGVFLKQAKHTSSFAANQSGFIKSIDPLELGIVCCSLGAGREKAGDPISYEVGMRLLKSVGERVEAGETWMQAYHNTDDFDNLYRKRIENTIEIAKEPLEQESLVVKIIDYM